jgi:Asp-tRNA(Asn)/Glu-tRNA(Gln) amidotransferase A subunit family amidase
LDVPGPMCRSVKDTALLLDILRHDGNDASTSQRYERALKGVDEWKELRVGTLDPEVFRYDSSLQIQVPEAIEQIVSAFKR